MKVSLIVDKAFPLKEMYTILISEFDLDLTVKTHRPLGKMTWNFFTEPIVFIWKLKTAMYYKIRFEVIIDCTIFWSFKVPAVVCILSLATYLQRHE